jgi:hypothetical protein
VPLPAAIQGLVIVRLGNSAATITQRLFIGG